MRRIRNKLEERKKEYFTASLGSAAVLSRCPSRGFPIDAMIAAPKLLIDRPQSEEPGRNRGTADCVKDLLATVLQSIS